MRKTLIFNFLITLMMLSIVIPAFSQAVNTLTSKEKKEGWILLFNGKDFTGWRQYNGTVMPPNWKIEDGAMKVFTAEGKKPGQGAGGDIIYAEKKFRNFELSIDWKTEKMGNSGIFYYVREEPGQQIYAAAPEVQILDNADATDNKIDSHLAGSLYDMLPADPKTCKPAGEWNTIVIRVKEGKVAHTQNGVKVVEYELWTPKWDEMVQNSKFKNFPGFIKGISKEGYIGLQDHGYTIWFRNIKIR
ncbi:MAG: 3-keto-disaccharide hydrolase, partial [Bacteroidales bacterium]